MRCGSVARLVLAGGLAIVPAVAGCSSGSGEQPSTSPSSRAEPAESRGAIGPAERTYRVDGVERSALVIAGTEPAPPDGRPLVLVFHGHGGSSERASRSYPVHELWPEAVAAYPQGLTGVPGKTDPAGERPGWQKDPGQNGDRDLAFVDTLLADLSETMSIDADRVYALGHSNGARFVNVIWRTRGERFAAFGSSSAQGGRLIVDAEPRPLFMSMGEADPLVTFENQSRSIDLARARLGTDPARATIEGYLRTEPGPGGLELATYVHPGGHEMPPEVLPLVVDFFERHPRPT